MGRTSDCSHASRNVVGRDGKVVDLPALSSLIRRLSANPLHGSELVSELLHLLPRFNAGHFGYIVVVKAFRMALNQVENFFFIGPTRHSRSSENVASSSGKYNSSPRIKTLKRNSSTGT